MTDTSAGDSSQQPSMQADEFSALLQQQIKPKSKEQESAVAAAVLPEVAVAQISISPWIRRPRWC